MKFRRSIKFNVWARFEAIVIAMLFVLPMLPPGGSMDDIIMKVGE